MHRILHPFHLPLSAALAWALTLTAIPPHAALAQAPDAAELPVTRVVLFNSGVGFFEHAGSVEGDGAAELRFKTEQINDVLKSLVLQDLGGGTVGTVVYPSRDPIARTLRSFQVDLTDNPPLAELLNQIRGAAVQVTVHGDTIAGTVLGVEKRRVLAGEGPQVLETWVLNLLEGANLRAVPLEDIQRIELRDADLQAELNQALEALSQARDQDKKPVTVRFEGQGTRRVRAAYIVQTPVWKTSYRLIMPDSSGEGSLLQGWAIVENQTDNDWKNVELALVSGRPISFVQELYEPLYVSRPRVEPEIYASLRPQRYGAGVDQEEKAVADAVMGRAARARRPAAPPMAEAAEPLYAESANWAPLDIAGSIPSIASAEEVGKLFHYTVPDVSLPRQRSAMIPIINEKIGVQPISIYNQSVLARHPLNGARLKNTTGNHLLQGPITVFDGGSYAGDASIEDLPAGQERLISYAVDLQVRVDATQHTADSRIMTGTIVKGVLNLKLRDVAVQEYRIQNEDDTPRTLVLEHPRRPQWELFDTPKPVETTEVQYRFEIQIAAGGSETLKVQQEMVRGETFALLSADLGDLQFYSQSGPIPPAVREALAEALRRRQAIASTEEKIRQLRREIADITQEQERIRANMETVSEDSQYHTRLLAKLDDQETRIEQLQEEARTHEERLNKQRQELASYLNDLDIN